MCHLDIEIAPAVCYLQTCMAAERSDIPDWARKERLGDMLWIAENLHVFGPAAAEAFEAHGRGSIVVDITSRPTGEGHPFGYFPQEMVEEEGDEDTQRMVKAYDPEKEIVILLLKAENRTSTYRVGIGKLAGKA